MRDFVVSADDKPAEVDAILESMQVGGWRRASLREECAAFLKDAIPDVKSEEILFIEFQLLSVK